MPTGGSIVDVVRAVVDVAGARCVVICVAAYGAERNRQKTFTMFGGAGDDDVAEGLIPRAASLLFHLNRRAGGLLVTREPERRRCR